MPKLTLVGSTFRLEDVLLEYIDQEPMKFDHRTEIEQDYLDGEPVNMPENPTGILTLTPAQIETMRDLIYREGFRIEISEDGSITFYRGEKV